MTPTTFPVELQQKILSLMVQDRNFLSKISSLIKPSYFDSSVLVDMCRITLDYFQEYGVPPTPLSLAYTTAEFLKSNPSKSVSEYIGMVDDIFSDSLPEKDFIDGVAFEFIQFQELRNAYAQSVELLEKHKFSDMKQIIEKAFSISAVQTVPLHYFNHEEIFARYQEDYNTKKLVKTGLADLDEALGGGLGVGELGLVLAPVNVGKSIFLSIFGANALRSMKNVLHVSLEMSKESVARRYDSNLVHSTKSLIQAGLPEFADKILGLQRNLNCNLIIEQFPTRGITVAGLRAYIDKLRCSESFLPDLLIVDYAQIMKPSRQRGGRFEEVEEVCEELRGLGGELQIPVWSAAQTNKGGIDKPIIALDSIGESYGMTKVADVIVSLNQTQVEQANDEIRLFLAKNRNNKKYGVLRYKTCFDIMSIIPNVD